MEIQEQLASFYVGSEFDLSSGQTLPQPVYYDARDLTTHGVIVGMTGSGKTGLGIVLLEEAALDGVPSLVIDPKGDMTNLFLTFPDLRPEDFRPWINPDDARRKGMELDAYAVKTAEQWRNGLANSGQGPERIRRLKDAADFVLYTPGSRAGYQVSILDSFKVPSLSWDTDAELLRDRIGSIVSALLGLVGVEADPVRSREYILLSNILEHAWRSGQDLDLAQLILRVQKPPFTQLGVFPVDTFFPEKDRLGLAMLLNGLIASPTFSDWMVGQPLDIDRLLHGPSGKPQVSILYIAHLSEAERQFFVTLLLEQVVSWVRAQSGTTSLRAILYMDEVFGYLPPHPANPPTKRPMLTLLKQARAFGLGLVLATQNPVDLDYKALSNAGTWFIGRMQADRDKQRLLDGLEGVEAGKAGFSRAIFDRMISSIQPRVFLLHNVHEDKPTVFYTRWAMSYLRGPLTRDQVRELVSAQAPTAAAPPRVTAPAGVSPQPTPAPAAPVSVQPPPVAPSAPAEGVVGYRRTPPQLPSSARQVFLPKQMSVREATARLANEYKTLVPALSQAEGRLVYRPALLGLATIRYSHTASRQTFAQEVAYLVPLSGEGPVDWTSGQIRWEKRDLTHEAEPGAWYAELPSGIGSADRFTRLQKEFGDHLFYHSSFTLRYNPHLKLYSMPDESDSAFQRRCREAAEKARDAEAQKIEDRYRTQRARLEEKLRREEQELEMDREELSARKQEELLSGAETLLGVFTRRRVTRGLSSASRKRRMTQQAKADVQESEKTIRELKEQIEQLEKEAQQALDELTASWRERIDVVEEVQIQPRRTDIQVSLMALAWVPHWEVTVAGQEISAPLFVAEPV